MVAGSQLWALAVKVPQLRAGSAAAFEAQVPGTVSDRTDKTRGWVICTAGSSSTRWGLLWLMNIEPLLSYSKLCRALQMSISARG